MIVLLTETKGRHALIILRGHELGGGSSCDTQQPQKRLCFIYLFIFLFIWNIPKHIK